MRRLCVFYKDANKFVGKEIEWIVCQECQKQLHKGLRIQDVFKPYGEALTKIDDLENHILEMGETDN